MGRNDILVSSESWLGGEQIEFAIARWEFHEQQANIETWFVKTWERLAGTDMLCICLLPILRWLKKLKHADFKMTNDERSPNAEIGQPACAIEMFPSSLERY